MIIIIQNVHIDYDIKWKEKTYWKYLSTFCHCFEISSLKDNFICSAMIEIIAKLKAKLLNRFPKITYIKYIHNIYIYITFYIYDFDCEISNVSWKLLIAILSIFATFVLCINEVVLYLCTITKSRQIWLLHF